MQTTTKAYSTNIDRRIYKRAETTPVPSGTFAPVGGLALKSNSVEREVTNWEWKRIIAQGKSATSYLQGTRWKSTWGHDGFAHALTDKYNDKGVYTGHNYYALNGAFWGIENPLNETVFKDSLLKADNQALARLNDSISSAQRDLQGSVALGELSEALRMIRRPGIGFRHGLDRYLAGVKKRFKGKRRWSLQAANEAVSDSWLEYAFGWRPLVKDVDDGAKALANALNWHPERVRVFGQGEDTWTSNIISAAGGDISHGSISLERDKAFYRGVTRVYYEGYVGYTPVVDGQVDFKRFGLGIDQFIPSIWNLIPYSFVVDYFSNVGAVLQAYSNNLNTNILWLKKGVKQERSYQWADVRCIFSDASGHDQRVYQRFAPGAKGALVKDVVTRSDHTGSSTVPLLELRIPGMSTKWINLIALITSSKQTRNYILNRLGN